MIILRLRAVGVDLVQICLNQLPRPYQVLFRPAVALPVLLLRLVHLALVQVDQVVVRVVVDLVPVFEGVLVVVQNYHHRQQGLG